MNFLKTFSPVALTAAIVLFASGCSAAREEVISNRNMQGQGDTAAGGISENEDDDGGGRTDEDETDTAGQTAGEAAASSVTAVGKTEAGGGEDGLFSEDSVSDSKEGVKSEPVTISVLPGTTADTAGETGAEEEGETDGSGGETSGAGQVNPTAAVYDFSKVVKYLKSHTHGNLSIDFSTLVYEPGKRTGSDISQDIRGRFEKNRNLYQVKRLRMNRADNEGSVMDAICYTDPKSRRLVRIQTIEYGSVGREVTDYYYEDASLTYAQISRDSLYGTYYRLGGRRGDRQCWFDHDAMETCLLVDDEGRSCSYVDSKYDKYTEFIRSEYDNLEKNLINQAYILYEKLRAVPGYARIYGYCMDEQGGILENVKVTIESKANSYNARTTSNGDGIYEFFVPVNELDWYNLEFSYGDWKKCEVNDVCIQDHTVEYCTGVTYMAPKGEGRHDPEVYLLDVAKQSPDRLGEEQYEIVLEYDRAKIPSLTCHTLDLSSLKSSSRSSQVVEVYDGSRFKYYLSDSDSIKDGDNMSYNMSLSEAVVKVYNKDGLMASFQVPAGRPGVVWEVFELDEGELIPVSNYYVELDQEAPGLY